MEKHGLIISKDWIKEHYEKQFDKLKTMFGDNWYLGKHRMIYYLVVGDCEMSFDSIKWDFASIINGIEFGLLVSKHVK